MARMFANRWRITISKKPVKVNGVVIGHICRYSDGTSAYLATKRILPHWCVNLGPRWSRDQ